MLFAKLRYTFKRSLRYLGGRFKNLQVLVVVAMSIVSLVAMVIFSVLIYQKIQEIFTDTAITNTEQVVSQTSATLSSYISNMAIISQGISEGLRQTYTSADELQDFLDASQRMGTDIVSITLFGSDGEVDFHTPQDERLKEGVSLSTQQWYEFPAVNGKLTFSPPHVQNLFYNRYLWVITLYSKVQVRGEEYVMAVDMNFRSINEYCSKVNIGKRGYIYLVDGEGKIVYHPQQQMVYAGIKEEDMDFLVGKEDGSYIYNSDIVVVLSALDNVGWKTVGISYLQDNQDTMNDILGYMGISYVAVFVLILLFSAAIARYISRPIGRIIHTMESAQDNQFTAYASEDNFVEVRRLSGAYNEMTQRIRELMAQIKREQRELRKTEIRALQAQINPHFLYNTLDSILWMCEQGDSKGAVVMVSALGTLFRISLSRGKEIITVGEELSHAENYLRIQGVRYKDQFDYQIDAPEELKSYRTPKIVLQPFLENAIYHGLGRSVDRGMIRIRVSLEEEKLLFEVEDNGVGMQEDLVERINGGEITSKSGIGISNVNSRIQIYFGKEYGVTIHSAPDEGTCIRIWLPTDITEDNILD